LTRRFVLPTAHYHEQAIPGLRASVGSCFVKVTDIPGEFDDFLEVNPRVPNRTRAGVLTGPVIAGIQKTLTDDPEDMAVRNQGMYLLVESAEFLPGESQLVITMHRQQHGIVNGGHTYAAIRDTVTHADEDELQALDRAYVRLHILQGIDEAAVPDIAEGLNRSKQVDDPSLDDLRGLFDAIKDQLRGKPGEEAISYFQGDKGDLYIPEVLVSLQLFNCERYSEEKHPYALYRKPRLAVDAFKEDIQQPTKRTPTHLLIPHVHEILSLADLISLHTPQAARRASFIFGRMKDRPGAKVRAGSGGHKNTPLPFIGKTMAYRVPRGWLMPMLAGFRANVDWDLPRMRFQWRIPLETLVEEVIDDLVRVCVVEHRDNNNRPEWVGNRESSYRQCYDRVLLHLARRGKLTTV
jgi:hypothetical protein